MAEVLGVVSAAAGIASFLIQVTNGIETLRRAIKFNRHQAANELKSLSADLETLRELVSGLPNSQNKPLAEMIVQHCQKMYAEVYDSLKKLLDVFGDDKVKNPGTRRKAMALRKMQTFNAEDDIKGIREKVSSIIEMLVHVSILDQLSAIQYNQASFTRRVEASNVGNGHIPPTTTSGNGRRGHDGLGNIRTEAMINRRNKARVINTCRCGPMASVQVSGRFWWLDYTPLSYLRNNCGSISCNRRRLECKFRLALLKINIPYAVIASFRLTWDVAHIELRPALTVQHVVDDTSPGFEALLLCRSLKITVNETKQRLRVLYRSDTSFRSHVNSAGESYLRRLVSYGPWWSQHDQFELLDFFVVELGMNFAAEDPGFLIKCSQWIGEGWHLELLDVVLKNGFLPNGIDPPATDQWPISSDPGWKSEKLTPDPFFIDYFARIVSQQSDFAGVTELQERIFTGLSNSELSSWVSSHPESLSMVNFLRQSPLHLAISTPQTVDILLDLGHDLDVTDTWGMTPLMYAAAMGYKDVTLLLISEGANPGVVDTRYRRTFLDFGITYGHWDLVVRALETIRDLYPHGVYQQYVQLVMLRLVTESLSEVTWNVKKQYVPTVIDLCDNVNFSFADSHEDTTCNNLMHYVQTIEEAEALVRRGFDLFNHPNSDGKLAIHSVNDSKLLSFCLDHGALVDHVDTKGRTLLLDLLSRLGSCYQRTADNLRILRQIRCCLSRGASPLRTDRCRCPCSPAGCSSAAIFSLDFDKLSDSFGWDTPDIVWIFEWLSMLQDFHGQEAVRDTLLSFIRRAKFEELGMTHVCCHRGDGLPAMSPSTILGQLDAAQAPKGDMDLNDVDEILEEEDEFIHILDQTMDALASQSVSSLREELMRILKSNYAQHLQKVTEEREKWQRMPTGGNLPLGGMWLDPVHEYSMSKSLAAYLICLDVEYVGADDSVSAESTRDMWDSGRMCWVKELMEVFATSVPQIARHFASAITSADLDLDTDQKYEKEVTERFIHSLRAS